jgi:hypothetical protein
MLLLLWCKIMIQEISQQRCTVSRPCGSENLSPVMVFLDLLLFKEKLGRVDIHVSRSDFCFDLGRNLKL